MTRARLAARVCSTEAAIVSSNPGACDLFATVTLKGNRYLTGSALAARYQTADGISVFSWVILLGSVMALKMHKR